MRNAGLALAIIVWSSSALSAPPWMADVLKSDNPEQLYFSLSMDWDCGLDEYEVQGEINDILTRRDLKYGSATAVAHGAPYMDIRINCIFVPEQTIVFHIDARFAREMPIPPILYDYHYGKSGVGSPAEIQFHSLYIAEVMTEDFIKANSSL